MGLRNLYWKNAGAKIAGIAVIIAILACSGPGVTVSPEDPRLQAPTANTGLNLQQFLARLNLFPADLIPIPWIVTPKSPTQFTSTLDITGWGPNRQNRPWPGDPTRSPMIKIYQLNPTGCDGEVTKELLATAEVTDSNNWGTTMSLSQLYGMIAATVTVGEKESGLSNKIIVGESALKPIIEPVTSNTTVNQTITLTGTGPVGFCVALVRDGQLNKFYTATVGQDGRWTISDVPNDAGSQHIYQVRLMAIGLDSEPATGSAAARPDLQAARNILKKAMESHYVQVDAPIQSAPGQRSASNYADVIGQFDLNSCRYTKGCLDLSTRCNIFAGDVMRAMGVPLPTKGDIGKGNPATNSTNKDRMTASASDLNFYLEKDEEWVTSTGVRSDWEKIIPTTPEELRRLIDHVNAGKPALVSSPDHIAVIRPDQQDVQRWEELIIAQAGRLNFLSRTLEYGFGPSTVKAKIFIHD